ncbi:hypothetical protein [Psychrobacillus sp. L4]|uniref:hypothetical protein n=1 Tax=Psychrobacillus sp. L4 TaxID=3236892 RepID=UPI0036F420D6
MEFSFSGKLDFFSGLCAPAVTRRRRALRLGVKWEKLLLRKLVANKTLLLRKLVANKTLLLRKLVANKSVCGGWGAASWARTMRVMSALPQDVANFADLHFTH